MTDRDEVGTVPPFPFDYRASGILLHVTFCALPCGV